MSPCLHERQDGDVKRASEPNFLPGRRPKLDYSAMVRSTIHLVISAKSHGKVSMSDDSNDWSKPAAMAIPKGGYFPTGWSRAVRSGIPEVAHPLRLHDHRQDHPRSGETILRTEPRWKGGRRAAALPGGVGSTPCWVRPTSRRPTSCTRHFRHRLRQVHRGRGRVVSEPWDRHRVRESRGFPRTGRRIKAFIKFVRDHHRPSFLEYG